jgi:hypothetical protein
MEAYNEAAESTAKNKAGYKTAMQLLAGLAKWA